MLICHVEELVPPEGVWRPRYSASGPSRSTSAEEGTTIVKLFLHISKEEQAERFKERLSDPTKNWKFNVADVDVRKRWDDYQSLRRGDRPHLHRRRRGTSCRPTASGTATGPWPRSSSTCSSGWTRCSPNLRPDLSQVKIV